MQVLITCTDKELISLSGEYKNSGKKWKNFGGLNVFTSWGLTHGVADDVVGFSI